MKAVRLFCALFGAGLLPVLSFGSSTDWQENPNGKVRLIAEFDKAPSKGEILLGLHFKPAPGWYVYWKFPGDAGYPPVLDWTGSQGISPPEVLYPVPTHILLPGPIDEYGYQGEVVYPVRAKLNGKSPKIRLQVSYLTCFTSCIPYKYFFELDVPQATPARKDAPSSELIQKYVKLVPPVGKSDKEIMRDAPILKIHPEKMGTPFVPSAPQSLLLMIALAFLGGVILNVMPCVLPVLSIKLLGLLEHSGQARSKIVASSLASAAGILVSFLALAMAAILARRAGMAVGWGIQFQQPVFLGFLAVIIFLFALNLWGAFEISMPAFIGRFASTYGWGESLVSYFTSGLFATLLATPCSAPFLGTAMGFALAQPSHVILLMFAAVGTGMSSPYFLLAVFPNSLHWLPRPGEWMNKIRLILGALLAATALWLCSILLTQIGHPIWRPAEKSEASTIHWIPFDEVKLSSLIHEGKPVFVDVTADWCVTCKYNERFVLSDQEVIRAFQKGNVVMMQADWTSHDQAITDYLKKFGRAGIPFYAYYAPGHPPVPLSEFLTKDKVLAVL